MIEVTAAVIERDGRILICRRRAGERFGGFWEFPGGKTESGETSEEGLRREIREELGMEVEVGAKIGTFPYREDSFAISLTAFRALGRPDHRYLLKEHEEARWIFPSELGRYDFAPADIPIVEILLKREGR
jgi:8-oxo-dGTP diphosphatase